MSETRPTYRDRLHEAVADKAAQAAAQQQLIQELQGLRALIQQLQADVRALKQRVGLPL
jgi:hypothetical protein